MEISFSSGVILHSINKSWKRPSSKIDFLKKNKKQLKHCPQKSYCSPKAARYANWCVSGVSSTILIDSQAHTPHRESESTDFRLSANRGWAIGESSHMTRR